jgi:squalene-hopene/tetraprenyl-beta-curcumene cyclase
MDFPAAQGFSGSADSQLGDVFGRALIADALQDAGAEAHGHLIDDTIEHLLTRRRNDQLGGWSYFPGLAELPADADDLAQVMLLFWRAGRRDLIERYCEVPLEVLLAQANDGAIPTWILPDQPRTPGQALQAEWVRLAWGSTADPEVVANLLHALAHYDLVRFGPVVVAGANWLASSQHDDGSWPSTWYHGPWYGTWQAVRLLAGITPHHPAVARARAFLIDSRLPDGGWGLDAASDPLSTAFALLALAATRVPVPPEVAASGLRAMHPIDGNWPAVPFIRMQLGRTGPGPVKVLTYASRTVTALFVLKAALTLGGRA